MTDIDELAYRFWSIHPKEIDEWQKTAPPMPEGYKGGMRAWFFACHMRAAISESALWDVCEYKIWKGIDKANPVWASLGFACHSYKDAVDLMEYMQGNAPEKIMKVRRRDLAPQVAA